MDIDKIIQERKLKDEQQKREEEQRAKNQQEEMYRERARREGNAEQVERHLKTVVMPVFRDAEQRLGAAGYRFSVSEVTRTDKAFGSTRAFALALSLEHTGGVLATLKFEGDFQSVTLTPHVRAGQGRAIAEPPMALSAVTREYVEKRTEDFLRSALDLPGQ